MLPYLARTFLERGDGFHFSSPPPADILDRKHLHRNDPWTALACVLANLQQGQFDVITVPVDLMDSNQDVSFWIACTNLLGYAAPSALVKSVFERFSGPAYKVQRRYVCSAAIDALGLRAVDRVLALYLSTSNDQERRYLQFELSWLLEGVAGAICEGPQPGDVVESGGSEYLEPTMTPDLEAYVEAVKNRALALDQSLQASNAAIAEGGPINITDLAGRLLVRLKRGDQSHRIDRGRMLLEAATGLDCRGFFNERYILRPLDATAIVEEFLESGEAGRYATGVRYFFGHPVPGA